MTTKSKPVEATAAGFYGSLRQPGVRFAITSPKHFSSNWMVPIGWEPEGFKGKVKPKSKSKKEPVDASDDVSEEAQAALDEIAAEAAGPDAAIDELLTFSGIKPKYGAGDVVIESEDAVKHAFELADVKAKEWNDWTQTERKTRIMGSVKVLVNERQAELAAE